MNSEAQLISSLQQLSHGGRAHGLNYYYGKVKKVDKGKHTCLVHLEDEDLDVEVNLRVGQQALDSYFVTYPKMGAQILFLSEAQSFGRAYLLQCSALDYVDISACTPLNIQVGEESPGYAALRTYRSYQGAAGTYACRSFGYSLYHKPDDPQ